MNLTKSIILTFLGKHKLMTIATGGKEHPWIACVYYTFDGDLNLYFLSSPETLHCKQIEANKHVAVSIADSRQKVTDKKKGLQIYGAVKQISGMNKVKHALRMWKQVIGVKDPELTYENMMKKVIKGRMYQVTPKRIKFFNQELFDVADGMEPVLEM